MVELKLWYLSLPKHVNLPDGISYSGVRDQQAELIWREHGTKAEGMKPGLHDLTPPNFRDTISANLLVHANFHGIHKIDQSKGSDRLLREPTLRYMSAPDGIALVRLPEDTHVYNVALSVGDNGPRLYYMLRWLQSPTQPSSYSQSELVGAGARISEPQSTFEESWVVN